MARISIETSLTLDYRKGRWGIERIVLDAVQNHMPADSGGTECRILLRQHGDYLPLKDADPGASTDEVVIEDDGTGYDWRLLSLLYSTKSDNSLSVGQHGEGLKLAAAAACREGIPLVLRSRDWLIEPRAKEEEVDGHAVKRLCFTGEEELEAIVGSRTIFEAPGGDLIEEVFKIPEKVLYFMEGYRVLQDAGSSLDYKRIGYGSTPVVVSARTAKGGYPSRVIELGAGTSSLFVKGFFVRDIQSLFCYDLGIDDIPPDRSFVEHTSMLDAVAELLKHCASEEVIGRIITEAKTRKDATLLEFTALDSSRHLFGYSNMEGLSRKPEDVAPLADNLWPRVFRKLYGENAVIVNCSDQRIDDAVSMGYRPVSLNKHVAEHLAQCGVLTVTEVATQEKITHWVRDEDLSLDERAMLDLGKALSAYFIRKGIIDKADAEVRVYTGITTATGREIDTDTVGFLSWRGAGDRDLMGVRRDRLASPLDFAQTYIHELGHHSTQAQDNTRYFTEFFVKALARLTVEDLAGAERDSMGELCSAALARILEQHLLTEKRREEGARAGS